MSALEPDLSETACLSYRVGVCGLGGPGQRPAPVVSGDLLVPVLSSLLLLLRAVLLLSRHLLLPKTPSVEIVTLLPLSCLLPQLARPGDLPPYFALLRSVRGGEDGQEAPACTTSCLSVLHPRCSRCPHCGSSFCCSVITRGAKDHLPAISGDQLRRRWEFIEKNCFSTEPSTLSN